MNPMHLPCAVRVALPLMFVAAAAAAQQPARDPGMIVSTDWLKAHLDDANLVIIHVDGNRSGYDSGHIPGARFISQDDITVDGERGVGYELPPVARIADVLRAAGAGDDRRIVIYSQNPLAATRLWLTLDYIGHGQHASILDGGWVRWRAADGPVSTDAPAAARTSLTPHPRPDMLVTAEWIKARLDDPKTLLIDARPIDEYTGDDGGMGGMAHPGHIPGAFNMYWEELIHSRPTDPSFLSEDQLRARFTTAGAAQATTVVAYCMIGARASLTYFVGRMLGYDMKFYDGSWHDWGTRDLPWVGGKSRR